MRMLKAYPENPCTLVLGSVKNVSVHGKRHLMVDDKPAFVGTLHYVIPLAGQVN